MLAVSKMYAEKMVAAAITQSASTVTNRREGSIMIAYCKVSPVLEAKGGARAVLTT